MQLLHVGAFRDTVRAMIQSNGRNGSRGAVLVLAGLLAAGTALGLPPRACAQEAASAVQDVALQDVTLTFGETRVTAPTLTVSGTKLSKDDILAILKAEGKEPWAARLARLEAGSLSAPELRVERADGKLRQVVTYRDVVAKGLQAGRVSEVTASGATTSFTSGTDPANSGSGSYGKMRIETLDLAALMRFYSEAGDGKGPLERLYDAFSIEQVVFGDDDTTVKIASIGGRDLRGRGIPASWSGALATLGSLDTDDPAERAKVMGMVADMIEGVSVGGLDITGLSVSTKKDEPAELGIGRVAYVGGDLASLALSDIAFAAAGSRSQLASLKLTGFSLAPTLATLRRLAQSKEAPDAELRRLTPVLGTVSLSGFGIDLPQGGGDAPAKSKDPLAKSVAAPPVHLGLREAAMTFGPPKDGVPVASRLSLGGMTLPAALVAGVPGLGALPQYGYRDLDLDVVADASWDEASKELALREISLAGKDMGSLKLTGTLGGIGPEVFDPDSAVSGYAMLSATAKALDVTVRNGGLFERFIDTTAKSLSLKPDELRKEYVTASVIGVPVILGNTPAAKAIGAAMGKFVTKPGTLSISARAKNGTGLGAVDFSTAPTPAAVLDKLDVNAKAE